MQVGRGGYTDVSFMQKKKPRSKGISCEGQGVKYVAYKICMGRRSEGGSTSAGLPLSTTVTASSPMADTFANSSNAETEV